MKSQKEKFKVYKGVFDNFTELNLEKLRRQKQYDSELTPLKIGKESHVFSATKEGEKIILKIYRLENCDFNKMYSYIKEDLRYINLKAQKRRVIFAWVQREFRNLHLAREGGVAVPTPYLFLGNILLEEFIGDSIASPRLKDAYPKNAEKFYKLTLEQMRKLFLAGLIHGDLSPFNILNKDEKPVLIDFSQSTLSKSPNAKMLLERDIKNMYNFFKKVGVQTSEDEMWNEIVRKEIV